MAQRPYFAATGLIIVLALAGLISSRLVIKNLALADSSKIVSVFADGQQKIVSTEATTVGDFLARAGIKLNSDDLVEPSSNTVIPHGFFNINVYRATTYQIVDGSQTHITSSAQKAMRKIVTDAGVTLYPEDNVETTIVRDFVAIPVVGQSITLKRATPIMLVADGQAQTKRTHAHTIQEFLDATHVPLGAKDTISPDPSTPIAAGLKIDVTRVSEAVVTKVETLPKSIKTETDPNLAKGTTQVKSEGSDGRRQATYRIHYRNGVEVARETLKIEGQVDATPKVVIEGTKVFFSGSVEYWRPMVVDAATANGIDPNRMLRIMSCESGGNANASNGTHFGLFQYLKTTWRSAGGTDDNIFDGPTQIRLTAIKMAKYGYSPWACQ